MDANYLKQTVGAALTSALTTLATHFPADEDAADPIQFVGRYLLHHDKAAALAASERARAARLEEMRAEVAAKAKTEGERKKRLFEELQIHVQTLEATRAEIARRAAEPAPVVASAAATPESASESQQPIVDTPDEARDSTPPVLPKDPAPADEPAWEPALEADEKAPVEADGASGEAAVAEDEEDGDDEEKEGGEF
ncbi:hypothetical protein BDK51DRAFT_32012 [Blyttiomyces helicus]|uniref:Dpy-30 motif-domain-containing protein n=1 Tax=Blyttiomyces helicus TaxID=388810 RepID=A0A4P9W509_9FUNG|nr:hypothetical protein BDK51DRAFT_32012 [Blyttiomyces helicus]|eukprot:RKO85978.1 hypothetical protein BDK51DRAFT_32012 [Blyttiomyces helicus]